MQIDLNINNYNVINNGNSNMPSQNNLANNPAKMALPTAGPAFEVELSNNNKDTNKTAANGATEKAGKTAKTECATCASRQYVDQSGDAGVSFKSPSTVAPEAAASAVRSHEQEHVTIAKARSDEQNTAETQSDVISNVRIFTSVCAECGKTYVAGGETQSTTVTKTKQPTAQVNSNPSKSGLGENIDIAA